MVRPSEVTFSDSLKSDQRKAFYEGHKGIAIVMILVLFLLPIVGVFVRGLSGAVLGVVISVVAYYLTPYAVMKIYD